MLQIVVVKGDLHELQKERNDSVIVKAGHDKDWKTELSVHGLAIV